MAFDLDDNRFDVIVFTLRVSRSSQVMFVVYWIIATGLLVSSEYRIIIPTRLTDSL